MNSKDLKFYSLNELVCILAHLLFFVGKSGRNIKSGLGVEVILFVILKNRQEVKVEKI
ncbi:hypothetical protein SAMN04487931_102218 [Desulfobacula phenolica]|uniref:Uncharacterized protein n=1 Tax=Desulfobacula phenolica TaxID=90732 RepID=A0A1H2DW27_9BACT|nr:hypothetical protein SAMN04487931_102218 [Desulfobacula phenolica]